jgi:hypothetical protein
VQCGFQLPDEYLLPYCPWHVADALRDAGPVARAVGLAAGGLGLAVLGGAYAWRKIKERQVQPKPDDSVKPDQGGILHPDFTKHQPLPHADGDADEQGRAGQQKSAGAKKA